MPHKYLLKEFDEFVRSAPKVEVLMQRMSERIHMHIPRYNWVGFYVISKKDPSNLVLGPHTGSFTPRPQISVTEGLCGAAVSTGRIIVADDVTQDQRYIQASDLVKSQLCAPIVVGGKSIAVLNVESYFLSTFKHTEERQFIERCAHVLAKYLEQTVVHDFVTA